MNVVNKNNIYEYTTRSLFILYFLNLLSYECWVKVELLLNIEDILASDRRFASWLLFGFLLFITIKM